MMRVTAIVEGPGDVAAIPTLVAKTGILLEMPAVSSDPIKAGEWKKLRRQGELERVLTLAASRSADLILLIVDLDDGCAVEERKIADSRINLWLGGRTLRVAVVFLVREYETMFLHQPGCLGSLINQHLPNNPEDIRGAKERIKFLTGRRYKETQDQVKYTQALNCAELYKVSRAYRVMCKAISGLDYPFLNLAL